MAPSPNISTHVLDTDLGRPARGVPVTLYRVNGTAATRVGAGVTDDDGRVQALLDGALEAGAYRLEFDLAGYSRSRAAIRDSSSLSRPTSRSATPTARITSLSSSRRTRG